MISPRAASSPSMEMSSSTSSRILDSTRDSSDSLSRIRPLFFTRMLFFLRDLESEMSVVERDVGNREDEEDLVVEVVVAQLRVVFLLVLVAELSVDFFFSFFLGANAFSGTPSKKLSNEATSFFLLFLSVDDFLGSSTFFFVAAGAGVGLVLFLRRLIIVVPCFKLLNERTEENVDAI